MERTNNFSNPDCFEKCRSLLKPEMLIPVNLQSLTRQNSEVWSNKRRCIVDLAGQFQSIPFLLKLFFSGSCWIDVDDKQSGRNVCCSKRFSDWRFSHFECSNLKKKGALNGIFTQSMMTGEFYQHVTISFDTLYMCVALGFFSTIQSRTGSQFMPFALLLSFHTIALGISHRLLFTKLFLAKNQFSFVYAHRMETRVNIYRESSPFIINTLKAYGCLE